MVMPMIKLTNLYSEYSVRKLLKKKVDFWVKIRDMTCLKINRNWSKLVI